MALRMFCGEMNGKLIGSHLFCRADSVRSSIARMVDQGVPISTGWARARHEGWRVVPVRVEQIRKDPIRK